MRQILPLAVVALLSLVSTGCGTLFTGTSDSVTFNTNPQGAMVMIDGIEKGRTPVTMRVKRSLEEQDVTLQLEGYEPRTFTLDRSFNTISILNLGNIFAWGIDAITGAVYRYDTKSYTMEMKRPQRALNMNELRRTEDGKYILPRTDQPLHVTDAEMGVTLVFEK